MNNLITLPEKGCLLTSDKSKKLDYKKNNENYEFVVSEGKQITFENHTRIIFKKRKRNLVSMSKNEFLEYLFSQTYLDKTT